MTHNQGEGAMQHIINLENKVREKNYQIDELKRRNRVLMLAIFNIRAKEAGEGIKKRWPTLAIAIIGGGIGAWIVNIAMR